MSAEFLMPKILEEQLKTRFDLIEEALTILRVSVKQSNQDCNYNYEKSVTNLNNHKEWVEMIKKDISIN